MATVPNKTCSTCGATRPMTNEHWRPDSRYRCGFMSRCRECVRADARKYRDRHLQYCRDKAKRWQEANPEAARRHDRAKWARHKDRYNRDRREQRKATPEAVRAVEREHYRRNRHKVLAWNRNYRLTKLGVAGTHSAEDIAALLEAQKGRCHWCGKNCRRSYDIDHRIPLSRGGTNDVANLVIACVRCNRSKHAHMPWEWRGRLL